MVRVKLSNDGAKEQPKRQAAKKSAGMYFDEMMQDDDLTIMETSKSKVFWQH